MLFSGLSSIHVDVGTRVVGFDGSMIFEVGWVILVWRSIGEVNPH